VQDVVGFNMSNNDSQWHLSKSIPISIIFGLFVQLVGAVWMFSQMDAAIQNNAERITRVETRTDVIESRAQEQAVQLGRIETQITALVERIDRVVVMLERQQ